MRNFKYRIKLSPFSNSYHIFAKQCWYSSTVNIVYVLYTCQLVQTIRKLIVKWWVLYFMKKVTSRKIVISWKFLIFQNSQFSSKRPEISDLSTKIPGNLDHLKSQKCKNIRVSRNLRDQIQNFPGKFSPKFLVFTKIWGQPFHEFPGILVDHTPENARIYGFPRILERKSRVFPGNFYENLKFSRHFGAARHEISGNFGRKTPAKCRNIRISRFFGGKNHYFPGNFGRPVARSRKNVVVPQACTFKNIRVSRSPQASILDPEKDPQKFICT